jgi:putative tryptophan/tyrosine transport system substrate-binding protein
LTRQRVRSALRSSQWRSGAWVISLLLSGRSRATPRHFTLGDPLVNTQKVRINTFALAARLPTIYAQREYVEAAGLMSYGPNYLELNRRAADYVDKILRGTKPTDLPVEQPTKFDLVIQSDDRRSAGT